MILRVFRSKMVKNLAVQQYFCTTALNVTPKDGLFDEPVSIKISGLDKNQSITLRSRIQSKENEVFISHGYYTADVNGCIDVENTPSSGGTYSGIDPMGFLASMVPAPGSKPSLRLAAKDVTSPHLVEISVLDGQLSLDELSTDKLKPLITNTINRWYMKKDYQRLEINEGRIRGTMFFPSDNSRKPGVIDMFGSSGRIKESRAALLASRGFTTLCLPYFSYSDLPKDLKDINFSYFKEAVEWFSHHTNVKPGGIGVLGISKGAELAMLMATHLSQVKCVVNVNGSPYYSLTDLMEGENVFFKGICVEISQVKVVGDSYGLKNAYNYKPENFIPVWKSQAKILIIAGEDDHQINPNSHDEFYTHCPDDKKHQIIIKKYPGAGHLIEPPYTPICKTSFTRLGGIMLYNGGSYPGHSMAQVDSWKDIIQFFKNNLNTLQSQL
ncbi:hypothetical protein SNE40_009899 [Patella caerulea]|uniref:Uncharacterized protein n=2 Tax=Patella caerulea TaxID=87958 RepID=A0AAN8JSA5_PATCE